MRFKKLKISNKVRKLLVIFFIFLLTITSITSSLYFRKKKTFDERSKADSSFTFTPFTSTSFNDSWGSSKLTDGNNSWGGIWSSQLFPSGDGKSEWAAISFGAVGSLKDVKLIPRPDQNSFPIDFVIQYSTDLNSWIDIPIHRYKNYPKPGNSNIITFALGQPVMAKGVRVLATKLSTDGSNYAFQLAELSANVSVSDFRLYSSAGDEMSAKMTNFYNIFSLSKDQKNYTCGNQEIGTNKTWGVSYSGEGSAWLDKFMWDSNEYKDIILSMNNSLPIYMNEPDQTKNGMIWNTNATYGHLGGHWLYESNAHFILSSWSYLKWNGQKERFSQIPDRVIKFVDTSNGEVVFSDKSEYFQRIGKFHNIGQNFITNTSINKIKILVSGSGSPEGIPVKWCDGDPKNCTSLSNYKLVLVGNNGVIKEQTFKGIDDASYGNQWDGKGWATMDLGMSLPPGDYYLELRNLGRTDLGIGPNEDDFFISPLSWATSFENVAGDPNSSNTQIAAMNGVGINLLNKNREAMKYQLEKMHGSEGILRIDSSVFEGDKHRGGRSNIPNMDASDVNKPSNFWDLVRFGYKDAYINTYFYGSLLAMSNIEESMGNATEAARYRNIATNTKQKFNEEFWDDSKGRYISGISNTGERMDIGFTPINLQAIYYGLADGDKASKIMQWIDGQRTIAGDTSVGADIYKFGFAPRTNTKSIESLGNPYWFSGDSLTSNPENWFWGIKRDGTGRGNFGWQEENGGSDLYFEFYDVVSRNNTLGADNSWNRFQALMNEFNKDGFYRESEKCADNYKQFMLAGPESGLPIISFLESFVGINPGTKGLVVKPRLPSSLNFAGVKKIYHWNSVYDIEARKDISTPTISKISTNQYKVLVPNNFEAIIKDGVIVNVAPSPSPSLSPSFSPSPTQAKLPSPTTLTQSCNTSGTSCTFNWSSVTGSSFYYFRADKGNDGLDCSNTATGVCASPTTTSYTMSTTPGTRYKAWVHAARTGSDYSDPPTYVEFTTPIVTPSPSLSPTLSPSKSPTPSLSLSPTPVSHRSEGDLNGDGKVGIQDLSELATNWGKQYSSNTPLEQRKGDINGDSKVGIGDLSKLASNWGNNW